MKNPRNIIAFLVLAILLLVVSGDFFQVKALVYASLWILVLVCLYSSYQIGIKKRYDFFSINLGSSWAYFVSILLAIISFGLATWIIQLMINDLPLKY